MITGFFSHRNISKLQMELRKKISFLLEFYFTNDFGKTGMRLLSCSSSKV